MTWCSPMQRARPTGKPPCRRHQGASASQWVMPNRFRSTALACSDVRELLSESLVGIWLPAIGKKQAQAAEIVG